ncbi:MAG TPA: type III secretion system outer membrane ring subunit SctC [Burkholderiaceae bacterium]|nr:type III secretion system outer membrane ring subunit SctC [Burkholderiaceae bacterium]
MSNLFLSCCVRIVRCAVVAALFATAGAQAGNLPNSQRNVSITAREQPIAAFLQTLMAQVDVPVSVSPTLTANVNGTFTGTAEKVLRDISRIYNLVTYYDGAVMHVVPAAEVATKTYAVTPKMSDKLLRDAFDLGLPDLRNTLRNTGNGNLVAVGTKRFIDQVDELARAGLTQQAAAAAPPAPGMMDFRVFYLRYAWAQDTTMNIGNRQVVVPGVASILRSLVGARTTTNAVDQVMRPTQPKLKGQGMIGQGVAANKADSNNDSQRAKNGVDVLMAALNTTTQTNDPAPVPMAFDPRQVTIEVEPRLNAVIVRDAPERLPHYEQLIAALDVEPQSLEIEATIIDVNTDRARELGINWRWSNAGKEASYSGNVPTTGPGGIASVVLGSLGQFFARIRALESEGAARVVSSPQVVTLSNVEALFDNTQTFFVRVAGREEVDLFNVSAGTTLRVMPHVFRDHNDTRIKLLVNVEDGNITGQSVDQIPIVERASINTQALINEGESLLIGGMVRENHSANTDKVPGLGDVPVVGNLFKNKTSSHQRIERMFLITPRLAGARPDATGASLRVANGKPAPGAPAAASAAAALTNGAPAQAPAGPPAQAVVIPVQRASVVLDLDALPAPAAAPVAPAGSAGAVSPATRVSVSNPTR